MEPSARRVSVAPLAADNSDGFNTVQFVCCDASAFSHFASAATHSAGVLSFASASPIRAWSGLEPMALGAWHRRLHPRLDGGVGGVPDGGEAERLTIGPALGDGHRVAIERGRNELIGRRIGQQVAGKLFDGEPVVRLV